MDKVKTSRINNAYMEQLNIIFGREIKNPILKNVVVTEVKVSSDLSYAKVYFTCFNDDKEKVIKEDLKNNYRMNIDPNYSLFPEWSMIHLFHKDNELVYSFLC